MEKWLNTGIQEVIKQYPKVGDILNNFNIGCTTCNPGTCILGDVVGIHNLQPEDEAEMMYQIEKEIYSHREVVKAKVEVNSPQVTEIVYSPPVKELVDEHVLIKRWLALVPKVVEILQDGKRDIWAEVKQGALFCRHYADELHHGKEENILFGLVEQESEIIKIMLDDHVFGRENVALILEAAEEKDAQKAIKHLNAFKDMLTEHIKKEDEILFPWIDRKLSSKQVGQLFTQFSKVNQELADTSLKYKEVLVHLEKAILS
ncbi:hemerythrin domain-containing protein [Alkalicella caledoniensis]|uniref:Hemerythrin domain-containing protein n=1 Tax=Alkalicella caledoniensis TaxID=2731377 RepID=A0A7G9W9J7_ALKCA|nr:hemerythrin domain-containing protein [Alkalicella caledoniensis]QNO15359.1 hemerythrin domain-containing protein [Alkalicella caledoniensis]